jgi:hypothetical protein
MTKSIDAEPPPIEKLAFDGLVLPVVSAANAVVGLVGILKH